MKNPLLTLAGVALAAPLMVSNLHAQETTLKLGDPAPALNVAEWVKGDAVSSLAKDKVYVIEFWATW